MTTGFIIKTATKARVANFTVRRALPLDRELESLGPFCFFDAFGPFEVDEKSAGVGAHPHAGIEVMTVLIKGTSRHRDTMGNDSIVKEGGMQLMCAGSGAMHAEKSLGNFSFGAQVWAKLKPSVEDCTPTYKAFQPEDFEILPVAGGSVKVLIGNLCDRTGPAKLQSQALLAHIIVEPNATIDIPLTDAGEVGVYCLTESVEVSIDTKSDKVPLSVGGIVHLGSLAAPTRVQIRNTNAEAKADVILLGGEPCDKPLLFGGPFVYHSREALTAARNRYAKGEMGDLSDIEE